jgi:hypothetical protein
MQEVVMAEAKTKPTEISVEAFINAIPEEQKRQDSQAILALLRRLTGEEPVMWGESIVGFGSYSYRYESGREGTAPRHAFSPRKDALTLYGMARLEEYPDLAGKLGKYKTGKGCLYIKKLADVDQKVLEEVLQRIIAAK